MITKEMDKSFHSAFCRTEGFAIVVVMGALAVLFIVAISLNAVLNREIGLVSAFKNEVQADLAARSAVAKALAIIDSLQAMPAAPQSRLLNSPGDFKDIKVGPSTAEIFYISLEGRKIYGLQDEEGKINVNKAPEELLRIGVIAAFAQFAKIDAHKAPEEVLAKLAPIGESIAKEIIKHRDQKKFNLLEELLSLKNVSEKIFTGGNGGKGLKDLLTVWGDGKININTAPEEVLSALPGMSKKAVASIIEMRKGPDGRLGTQDDGIRNIGAIFAPGIVEERYRAKLTGLIKLRSDFFKASASARVMSGSWLIVEKKAIAVLDSSSKPPKIVYWRKL